ncbi:MAG: type III-A CRISPR-associated RAMP protein Csm5 [Bacteroidia bacterium]|nr:type III-A CRISPR-associated RAMP protein Csm5 [Bacteroidia bacterium]
MNRSSYIKLKVISPVCIGNDQAETLSPYTDFVLSDDGKEIHYIKHRELEKALVESEKVELFQEQIAGRLDNNRSDFTLKDFIVQRLGKSVEDLTYDGIPNRGIREGEKHQVKVTLHSAGRPYISGSTLKGAIRTALLHDWLKNDSFGKKELRRTYNEVNHAMSKVDEFGRLSGKKKRARLDSEEFRRWRFLSREISKICRDLLDETKLFGYMNHRERPVLSQFLQVSDADAFDRDSLAVFQAERVRLKPLGRFGRRKGGEIPQPREAILQGNETQFRINLRKEIANSPSKTLGKLYTKHPDPILEAIRKWSKSCIGLELDNLEEAYEMPNRAAHKVLIDFYQDLYDRAENGSVFLRVGMGKTYYENSLAIAMMDYAEEVIQPEEDHDEMFPPQAFREFRKLALGVGFSNDLFPVTRTLTTIGHLPMGWVELSL